MITGSFSALANKIKSFTSGIPTNSVGFEKVT